MNWNHRVIKTETPDGPWFAIHEVYYDDEGNLSGYSEKPVAVCGEGFDEIEETLKRMLRALEKPILAYGDFK